MQRHRDDLRLRGSGISVPICSWQLSSDRTLEIQTAGWVAELDALVRDVKPTFLGIDDREDAEGFWFVARGRRKGSYLLAGSGP